MLHLFLTPSPLLAAGEALVGISLPMFVAALIAAYGGRIRLSAGRCARTDSLQLRPGNRPSWRPLRGSSATSRARERSLTVGLGQELRPASVMEDLINNQASLPTAPNPAFSGPARHGAEEPKYRGDSLRVDAKNATSTLKIGRADKGVRLRSRRYATAAADAPNGL
jgi:hypothetical protein